MCSKPNKCHWNSAANEYSSTGHHEQKNQKTTGQIKFSAVTRKQQKKTGLITFLRKNKYWCIDSNAAAA